MGVPREVVELAERFDRNVEAYRAGQINEESTKVSYINPLFEALGWDVRNLGGRPGAHKEVVFEDRVKIGGGTKAPDYGFYVGGSRRFFLEAKKPSVDLAGDVIPAVQLRRYAWTARHPLSILTDFEELAVYDCRVEPGKDDKPATARAMYLRYDEYEARWDELYELFGREAVRAGSLEKFAESEKTRRGTETVDRAFLREIEGWRDTLARSLASRNGLNQRQLNYAVQTTIDRIIFLRMAEDRGIEDYGRLLALTNGNNVYGRMLQMFREADDRYNSGLFHFRSERGRLEEPDDLTPGLSIDDGALAGIIRGLYYPESPYEFSVLPVDVLGQVYEQFLGSVIRLETSERAVVEQKPEVRKAGGVYYTPTYIVDYIVENTVGKLLEGKRPGPRGGASRLKIVDPACGSGSFLIGAYEHLLDWHRDRYVEDGPEKHQKRIYEGPGGEWHLTIDEKKRILVNNIYGVDIDPQAVEVTKLSLLLKVLEGETDESITRQLSLFAAERALPDLDANIKCGNSLIGPDFYDEPQMSLLEEEEHYRINVFDWRASFPHVFDGDDPGFDAVIGNPPYVRPHKLESHVKEYFWSHYKTFVKKSDLYCCFVEQGANILRQGGTFGYIVSSGWLRLDSFEQLRLLLLRETEVEQVIEFPYDVFADANVKTTILILSKQPPSGKHEIEVAASSEPLDLWNLNHRGIEQRWFKKTYKSTFDLSLDESQEAIKEKMRNSATPLGELFDLSFGLKTGDDAKFVGYVNESSKHRALLRGENVQRYHYTFQGEYVWYDTQAMREHRKTARPGNAERFEQPKMLVRDTGSGLRGTFEEDGFYTKDVLIVSDKEKEARKLKFLTGVLNSCLMRFYYETSFPTIHVQRDELAALPIRTIDFSDAADVERHERMVRLVERMLDLHGKLSEARIERERTVIGHRIAATDREIDRLVYELYGLSDEEVSVVEGSRA